MNYIYRVLYDFYLNWLEKQEWTGEPLFYCVAVISMIESMISNSLISFVLYKENWYSDNKKWISLSLLVLLFILNWNYFKKREAQIIRSTNNNRIKKMTTYLIFGLILLSIILFYYSGLQMREYNLRK